MKNILPYVLSLGMLALVASCGSDDDDSDSLNELEEGQNVTYRAVLNPVNGSGANGTATIRRNADEFEVDISMAGAPTTVHAQHIHSGSACPTAANAGASIIQLDSDLSSNDEGGVFPAGRSYRYSESTPWIDLVNDLGQTPRLSGRVIEIHGTTDSRSLPIACGVLVVIPSED